MRLKAHKVKPRPSEQGRGGLDCEHRAETLSLILIVWLCLHGPDFCSLRLRTVSVGASVTHVAWSSGCFYLLRIGLPSGSCFYGETNNTWPASSGRVEV